VITPAKEAIPVENLLVATPTCTGIPNNIITGSVINPAPPASVPRKAANSPMKNSITPCVSIFINPIYLLFLKYILLKW
jgi:hypothetical protein